MKALLIALVVFSTPAGDFRFYDRAPSNREATKFYGEDISHRLFGMKLYQLGVSQAGPEDQCWMADAPFAKPLRGLVSTCGDTLPRRAEFYEVPQADLYPADRGVWRSYLLVVRKGGWAVPDSHVAVVTRDSCITLDLEKRR